jgi:peptidylprolyl isomerase
VKRTRALLAVLPVTLLAAALAGCSAGGGAGGGSGQAVQSAITADASGAACSTGGAASESVSVDGEMGELLTLTSETPLPTVEGLQRSVLVEGETTAFPAGDDARASVTIFNGKTGETINHLAAGPLPNDAEQLQGADWAYEAVRCAAEGQRVAIVVPAGDVAKDDPFVFVLDFLAPYDQFADCESLTPRDEQYPEVDLGDGTSEPTITIPECMEAPEELEIEVLVEGDGAVVAADQNIMTNYVGVYWNGAERFDGSWNETGVQFSTAAGALIDGFTQAMVGQKIGSTILVTVPSELGYDDGNTRTFVLQLVGPAPAG